jgi:hypothetical protein
MTFHGSLISGARISGSPFYGAGITYGREDVAAFSPASLFAAGEVGAWYDPSDLTTIYQDTGGLTPVTTPGQTVALMLDKSRQRVFEARRNGLVQSNSFSSSPWQKSASVTLTANAGTDPTGGNAAWSFQTSGAGNILQPSSVVLYSTTNRQSIWVKSNNGSNQTVTLTQFWNNPVSRTVTTDWTRIDAVISEYFGQGAFRLDGTDVNILIFGAQIELGTTPTTYQAIGASLPTAWLGNHATQATAASRPTYGIAPRTGRRNLLLRSQSFVSPWSVATGSITSTTLTAPDGTSTGSTLTASAGNTRVLQTVSGQTAGATFTFSAWVKASASGGAANVRLTTNDSFSWNTGQSQRFALTSDWQRLVLTGALSTGPAILVNIGSIDVAGNNDALCTGNIDIWGAQLETGSTATTYQRVTTQWDVTEAGVPSLSYLGFDGVDDGMLTSTINFSATDKVAVFAGLRKLSDVVRGTVTELTASVAANNGGFHLTAPNAASATFAFESKGTALTDAVATSIAAPATRVLTGAADIGADSNILRVNGVQADSDTDDQGTGNYANAILYIGRRGGTTSPFAGNIYGLIVRGAATGASGIGQTETWLNQRTGAY